MQMLAQAQSLVRQFILFCGVGAINTVVSLLIILLLSNGFGVYYMISNFLGYLIGLGLGFVLHSQVTFKSEQKNSDKKIIAYFRSFAFIFWIAYLCQLALLYILVDVIRVNEAMAQIVAVGMYTMISFLGNKFWTFK